MWFVYPSAQLFANVPKSNIYSKMHNKFKQPTGRRGRREGGKGANMCTLPETDAKLISFAPFFSLAQHFIYKQ